MTWRFSTAQNWYISNSRTPIPQVNEEIHKQPNFIWPTWAIQKANELGGNINAIQIVSKLLEEERKKSYALSN